MEGSNLKIVLIGVLWATFLMFGCPQFLHSNAWYLPLVYHIYHANIFHLAVNSLSLWVIFRKGAAYNITPLLIAYAIASASWFCTSADVVGFSNIIFALIGLRTPSFSSSWWRHPQVIIFLVVTAVMALFPQVSAVTHIVSFILGCIVAATQRVIKTISNDYRRASYC